VKIRTEHVYPPIPIRQFDWCAYDYDTYDGPGSILGHGATEQAAIADFITGWEEKYGPLPFPKPCCCCGAVIESSDDTEWHGFGNCVEITDEMEAEWEREAKGESQ
jgi:hypothetical protein